ncbi:MAG: phosphonate ABC transporter ATP-binding protein [Armatimonadetes bacterium]|nr:phosphonate ABC transporter ATP-binding protein [Armatimonadota bacterium]
MLAIHDVHKVFPDGTRALNGITLEVQDGEFVSVLGLSGAGKSTLLRCINRLVEPTSGTVMVDGVDVTRADSAQLRQIRTKIGMIFQQFNIIKRATVLTNVLTGRLGVTPVSWAFGNRFRSQDYEDAMADLERVGIASKAHQRAGELSGGQQQRVAIARALMQRPRYILADEPVASLDPATSHSVLKYLEQVNREDGITVLCNLHVLSLARRYATRVIALKAGELVFDGLPDDIDEARFKQIYGQDAEELEIQ